MLDGPRAGSRSWLRRLSITMLAGFVTLPLLGEASTVDWEKARQFWSYQLPQPRDIPSVKQSSWPRQRVDYFILARQEAKGLTPSPAIDRRTWLRRASFTLTGLPPDPSQIGAFLADQRPDAHERMADALLNSPAFGERMASLWLTLARYAEDQAHLVGDQIQTFYPNAYLYRDWVVRSFNEDLPYDRFVVLQLAADLVDAPNPENEPALGFLGLGPKYYNRGRLDVKADEWEDRVDTVSRTFLGLTVSCARCHDHKYDPITTEDYHALAGVFASTQMYNKPLDPAILATHKTPDGKPKPANYEAKDPRDKMHIVREGKVQDLNLFIRGNVEDKGPVIPRRFLRVLSPGEPKPFTGEGSGRLDLARAIADPANPLTARVMVNRLWSVVFGKALVTSESNFGALGQAPTHPALLDDLATRFVQGGWRIKPLLREFVLSATFRQSIKGDDTKTRIDPHNALFWRMDQQRLSAEMYRDAILSVAGNLGSPAGPSLELDDPNNTFRTVYGRVSRLEINPFLLHFDYPDANVHHPTRARTTTPMQKLFVLNNPFMLRQAELLAGRLAVESDPDRRIDQVYELVYGRLPTATETGLAREFLGDDDDAWVPYAQMLLAANEMMYVD